jgi:flagellar biosynthesis protein FlhG
MSATVGRPQLPTTRTKTISITSGKGGVGKSTLLANLALQMARQNKHVLILDGDLGMANVDVMYGLRAPFNLEHVLSGQMELSEIIVDVAPNIRLIPGGSGVASLQNLGAVERQFILDQVSEIDGPVDILLIDTASGIDDNVLTLNSAAEEILVVVTPDPSSMTDAYALIKILHQRFGENRFSIVLNMVTDEAEAKRTFKRLGDVAQNFLNVSLSYKGFVPMDADLRMATKAQQLVTRESPQSLASQHIQRLAENLSSFDQLHRVKGGMQFFWERLVSHAS